MAVTGAPELLIVMGASATQEQVDEVVARLDEAGCSALVTPGREATVIGAIGERELLATLPLEGFAGVEQVLPILKPYKLVSRELSPDPTVIEVRGRRIGDGYFGFIAGPCTVETREQTLETARAVAAEGVTMLRGGAFKPRTSPYAFQGLGDEALKILKEARAETGLPLVTELMDPRHVEAVVEAADVIQIGARNMSNFSLLSEVGRAPKPVLLKRGLSSTVEDLLMAAEYIVKEGNSEVILCERGIKTFETATRFTLDIGAIPVLKQETHLPVIVDPSHPAGRRDLVLPLARAAVAAGADGIIVEVHPRPEEALCDAAQQIPTSEFHDFADEIRALASLMGRTIGLGRGARGGSGPARSSRRSSGTSSCPGDKSISHRAVLIGALGEGETRVHGFGRSGDTQATVDAVRALGAEVEDVADDELVVRGAACAGCDAGDASTARNAGTLMRLLTGVLARPGGRVRAHRRRVAHPAADGAGRGAAAPDGGGRGDDRRACAARRPRLGRAARDRDRAAGGERAGEVGDPPRRPQRGGPTTVVERDPDPRPHRAHARGGGRSRAAPRRRR